MISILTLSLLLLSPFDSAIPLPQVEVSTSVQHSSPPLRLNEADMLEYRRAMHLIDVRGKYEEGVAKLDQLIDKDSVLSTPGQSSWLMAQILRALTLAGKGDSISQHLPMIRSNSAGTEFEECVSSLLFSFASQGAGLDAEFLQYIRNGLQRGTSEELVDDFGHDLLPYLRYLVDNEHGDAPLHIRLKALNILFAVNEANSVAWINGTLQSQSILAKKTLMMLQYDGDFFSPYFVDEEARAATAQSLILYSQEAPESHRNPALGALLTTLQIPLGSGLLEENDPTTTDLQQRISSMIEQGYLGVYNEAYAAIADLYQSNESLIAPLVHDLANHSDEKIRFAMRWAVGSSGAGLNMRREWAKTGSVEDHLRFCLLSCNRALAFRGNKRNLSNHNGLVAEWADTFLTPTSLGAPFPKKFRRRNLESEDYEILASMKSSPHPLVRYLAASSLSNRQGHQADGVLFLQDLGDDPQWAVHLLRADVGDVTPEVLAILLPLAKSGPLQEEVRHVLEQNFGDSLTVELWESLNLSPDEQVIEHLAYKASSEKDLEALTWILLREDLSDYSIGLAATLLTKHSPVAYLNTLQELQDSGRRWKLLPTEQSAWTNGLKEQGTALMIDREDEMEQFFLHGSSHSASHQLAIQAPDSFLRLVTKHLNDADQTFLENLEESFSSLRIQKIQDRPAAIHFATTLVAENRADLFDRGKIFFGSLLKPYTEETKSFYSALWNHPNPESFLRLSLFSSTIQSPELRNRFQKPLLKLLSNEYWVGDLCAGYQEAAAVDEILDELLLALDSIQIEDSRLYILSTISTVDDPRVIQALLASLDDPSERVSNTASAKLRQIQELREQKEEWAAWADGRGPMDAITALIENLQDPIQEIRLASIASLGTLHATEALPALVNLLRDPDEKVKEAARVALEQINSGPPEELVEPIEPKEPVEQG